METVDEVLQTVGRTIGVKDLTLGDVLRVLIMVLVGWLVIRLLMRMVDRLLDRIEHPGQREVLDYPLSAELVLREST